MNHLTINHYFCKKRQRKSDLSWRKIICVQESCAMEYSVPPLIGLFSFGMLSVHTSGGDLPSLIISGKSWRWTNRVQQHEDKASTSEGSVLLMFFVSSRVCEVHDKLSWSKRQGHNYPLIRYVHLSDHQSISVAFTHMSITTCYWYCSCTR